MGGLRGIDLPVAGNPDAGDMDEFVAAVNQGQPVAFPRRKIRRLE